MVKAHTSNTANLTAISISVARCAIRICGYYWQFSVDLNQEASEREKALDWGQAAGDGGHLTGGK